MSNDRSTRGYGNKGRDTITIQSSGASGDGRYQSDEQRAKEEAYQEYLRLREKQSSRGGYVKDDTLYGEYFPGNGSGGGRRSSESDAASRQHQNASGDADYRTSEIKRRRQQEELEKERYLAERSKVKNSGRIAMPGRRNKADEDWTPKKSGRSMSKKNGASGKGTKRGIVVVLVLILVVGGVIAAGFSVVKNTLGKVGRIEINLDNVGIDPQVDADLQNYQNIALLGIDSRDMDNDEDVRSDAIIVASISKETGEIKMFSVYRDTMLDLGDDVGLDKITHAYFYGGPEKVLYTLNKNLDLNIKEVVVVNWKSVADTVDALGGLEIEIQESEINEMNKYIQNTYDSIGGSNEKIESAGMQTLNGNQAVTYARIRKDAVTGDYRRNERMKIVVKAAFEKAKTMDADALEKISGDILPQIKTNMTTSDMMGMILKLGTYSMTDSVGWPYQVSDWTGAAYYGIPVTLTANVAQLHEQFFAQEGYIPTQSVQIISESIAATTGYY